MGGRGRCEVGGGAAGAPGGCGGRVRGRARRRDTDRKVHADDIPELRSFLTGISIDRDAVTAGLTLPYSSGVVEGHVNRIIKMTKRQMYGRAGFDLLRARVLHTPHGRP
jgi:transposase